MRVDIASTEQRFEFYTQSLSSTPRDAGCDWETKKYNTASLRPVSKGKIHAVKHEVAT